MKHRSRYFLVLAAAMLLLAGCGGGVPRSSVTTPAPDSLHRYLPVDSNAAIYSTVSSGNPDDVVLVPDGARYRGNVQTDVPPVPLATAQPDGVVVTWRPSMTVKAGQTKYDIIKVLTSVPITSAYLYADGAPSWLGLLVKPAYVPSDTVWGPVLIVTFGPNAPVGTYELDLGIIVNGVDFGTVPITLNIL
jgi:hypothetical protein